MRTARLAVLLLSTIPVAACLTSSTLITVKPDGSGTIEQTTTMSPEAFAQVAQLTSGLGATGERGRGGAVPDLFSETEARAAAGNLGTGVTFVSSEKIKTAEAEGLKAVYAFADVTKVRINQKPSAPAAGMPGMKMGGSGPDDIHFRFARQPGGTSVVTLVFPEVTPDQVKRAQSGETAKSADPQALSMAKLILKDLRISIALQVAGRIVRTNSPHVQGQRVTLLDMDFNQLLADESILQKLQGIDSLEQAKTLFKGVKGFTFNFDREVTVEFAAR